MKRTVPVCVFFVALASLGSVVSAGQWPRFRGPEGAGRSPDVGLTARLDDSKQLWQTKLPGEGHSSPVIWGDRLYITAAEENRARLIALETATGRIAWQRPYTLEPYRMNSLNHYASGSAACDADGVYVIWSTAADTQVVALDHAGRPRWERSFGPTISRHGPSKSPMVYDGRVVFTMEQYTNTQDRHSAWYALDAKTGHTVWRLQRDDTNQVSYNVPCVWRPANGSVQLIFSSHAHGLTGVDPKTGTVLWEQPTACPARAVGCPVVADDLVLATSGTGTVGHRLTAVRPPAAEGDQAQVAWSVGERRMVPYVPTLLVVDDLIYAFHDQGTVTCFEARTGKVAWSEKPGGRFYASGIYADGKVYGVNMDGRVVVLRAGRRYELLGDYELGEKTFATPAIVDGRLYVRTRSAIHCFDLRQEAPKTTAATSPISGH